MKVIDKLREVTDILEISGIESAARDAELFFRHGLNMDIVAIYRDNPDLKREQIENIEHMIQRRQKREPLQYILGFVDFLDLKLLVGPGVLVPRPETEFMAEQVIKAAKRQQSEASSTNILDMCTGSGCLALAVAKEFSGGTVCGTDISEVALDYAYMNAEINRIRNVSFLKGSLFQPLEERRHTTCQPVQFDFIISNPPYIQRDEIKELQPEVKNWEPVIALDGGQDGLEFFRELIPASKSFLNRDGIIMFELGKGQSDRISDLLISEGFYDLEIVDDYAGIERIIKARCRKY